MEDLRPLLSLKVLGVTGETMHPDDLGHSVHDLLFNTLPVLPPGTAKKFMEITEIRERHFSEPEKITDEVSRRPDADELGAFGRLANIHPLAHAFYTRSAFRYGDHVAKIAVYPGTAEQEALAQRQITDADDRSVLRDRHAAPAGGVLRGPAGVRDDPLAFRPWNGLAAHRPLGSVNRLRRRAYEVMGAQRFALNDQRRTEMTSISELPD